MSHSLPRLTLTLALAAVLAAPFGALAAPPPHPAAQEALPRFEDTPFGDDLRRLAERIEKDGAFPPLETGS